MSHGSGFSGCKRKIEAIMRKAGKKRGCAFLDIYLTMRTKKSKLNDI
jgi:hypothetical protein